jgi:chorismate mutase
MMAVEVANPVHVKLALEHDIDVLWIGARTTVNPFTVQEIAEALENTDRIVLVKNPVNPDLGLWLGGIERLHNAGVRKLGAVHRGFSTYEKSLYRNIPEWQIPIELQNRLPGLPLLCDPSHIGGRRDLIAQISQQALDLNYDGLMIETHPDPDNAWSDAAQQVTPEALKTILGALQIRERTTESPDFHQQLAKLRAHIDIEDSKLLDILSHRMKIAEAIGALKRENNVAVLQIPRWQEILEKMTRDGLQKGLSEEFILRLIKAVHQESILHQERVINK